ncbi:hypothetical protein [Pseudomonas sp. TWI929]|uniref:hypothetical protein n=1 Tax=Pseudomonas sp. TWI929 TaxID=3136795 RepID=UPI00320A7794
MSDSERAQKAEQKLIENELRKKEQLEKERHEAERQAQREKNSSEEEIKSIMLNTQRMNACDIAAAKIIGVHRDKVTTTDEDGVWISQSGGYTFVCGVKAFGGMKLSLMNGSRAIKDINFDYTASTQNGITVFIEK